VKLATLYKEAVGESSSGTDLGIPNKTKIIFLAGWCVAICCAGARAQESAERLERNLQQIQRDTQARVDADLPLNNRALVDYGGYLTFGYFSFDDSIHDNHAASQYELVGYGQVNLDGQELYLRGRGDYFDYNPGDSVDGEPNHLDGRVEEAWYHFDLRDFNSATHHQKSKNDIELKAGRQFVAWGNGLTMDQYTDGISGVLSSDVVSLELLAGVTVRETIDFDTSRPDFEHSTKRGFFGARLVVPIKQQNPYAFILAQRDYNHSEPEDAHIIPTRYRYNSYYIGVGSTGPISDHFAYGTELCFEGGRTFSNSFDTVSLQPVGQTVDPIEAYAANARIDYLPNDSHRSKFSIEGILASGDGDRVSTSDTFGGNRPHTGDHAFNSLGVLNTGLAFAAPVSNLMVVRLGASTFPLPRTKVAKEMQVGMDLFFFGKTRTQAPIDEPTENDRYLGCEPDLYVNWQLTEDITFITRYGVFFPGSAIPSGTSNDIRQFVYAAVTYAF
jgi:hypothetical protein